MALLNKQKTNQFRTNMLMKWSRPGADGGGGGGGGGGPAGGFATAPSSPLLDVWSLGVLLEELR